MENRLTIENFGPIRSVNIPLKEVTIFIGNQGTGKSTIIKLLACFLSAEFFVLHKSHPKEIFLKYRLNNYLKANTKIELNYHGLKVKYLKSQFKIEFPKEIGNDDGFRLLMSFSNLMKRQPSKVKKDIITGIRSAINTQAPPLSLYIPAERNILTSISESPFSFLKGGFEFSDYLIDFGEKFDVAKKLIPRLQIPEFKINFFHKNGKDYVIHNSSKQLLLVEASSGVQNLIPVYLTLEHNKGTGGAVTLIEEPEISLFPQSQYGFVKYLCDYITKNKKELFISTHSPYVLSTINNLLFAHKVGKKRSKQAAKIIEKKYWLNPSNVSAHILKENGESEDLMDYELGQLKIEKIDEISEVVNREYDALNDILWSKK